MLFSWFLLFQLIANASEPTGQSIFDSGILWHNEAGQEVNLNQFKSEALVIGLAYTTCRITCPLVVQQLKDIEKLMDQKSIQGEIIFVTIDPDKDTIKRLANYKKKMNIRSSRWHFLRASNSETRNFAKTIGFEFNISDEHIWHDRKVLLIDDKGHVRKSLEGFDATLDGIF